MGCVYLVTSPSGKQYVGETKHSFALRWQIHQSDARRKTERAICHAIRKYGADAFTHEILHDGIDNQEERWALEDAEILARGTLAPHGYNLKIGGQAGEFCAEVKKRMSRKSKANWETQAYRDKVLSSVAEAYERPGFLAHRGERIRAGKATPEAKLRASLAAKEVAARPGMQERRVEKIKVTLARPEVKDRQRANTKAALAAPDVRKKMSVRAKLNNADPVIKAKISAGVKAAQADPEVRKKLSIRSISRWEDDGYRARSIASQTAAQQAMVPSVFCDGAIYPSQAAASRSEPGQVHYRIKSKYFPWWFKLPHHRDPECDAVEECWAQMQFAAACPDHPNVPDWLRDPELVALEQEVKDMLAERRRRQAASSEQAAA